MVDRDSVAVPRRSRLAAVLAGGMLLLWVTIGTTLTQVGGRTGPELWWWPVAAAPRAARADRLLADDQSPTAARAARAQAIAVLLREPVNVTAARVAGLATALTGNERNGRRLLDYAQSLSRRDLGTQVALVQLAVTDGDPRRALQHYDIALRTSYSADPLLMPVLVAAAASPPVAEVLRPMLARRPPWRMRFVYSLLTATPWPADLVSLIAAARLDPGDPLERDFLTRTIKGLVSRGAVGDAAHLYTMATRKSVGLGVHDANFTAINGVAPFDWDIMDGLGLGAVAGPVAGAPFSAALSINADPGRSGTVAQQLLMLGAGRYRLRFTAGSVAPDGGDRSSVTLICNGTPSPLASVALPRTDGPPRTTETAVTIPSDCPSQWISIQAGTDIDTPRNSATSPWISGVSVTRS